MESLLDSSKTKRTEVAVFVKKDEASPVGIDTKHQLAALMENEDSKLGGLGTSTILMPPPVLISKKKCSLEYKYREYLHSGPHRKFSPMTTGGQDCVICDTPPGPCTTIQNETDDEEVLPYGQYKCDCCDLVVCESCHECIRGAGNVRSVISLRARWKFGYSRSFLHREAVEKARSQEWAARFAMEKRRLRESYQNLPSAKKHKTPPQVGGKKFLNYHSPTVEDTPEDSVVPAYSYELDETLNLSQHRPQEQPTPSRPKTPETTALPVRITSKIKSVSRPNLLRKKAAEFGLINEQPSTERAAKIAAEHRNLQKNWAWRVHQLHGIDPKDPEEASSFDPISDSYEEASRIFFRSPPGLSMPMDKSKICSPAMSSSTGSLDSFMSDTDDLSPPLASLGMQEREKSVPIDPRLAPMEIVTPLPRSPSTTDLAAFSRLGASPKACPRPELGNDQVDLD